MMVSEVGLGRVLTGSCLRALGQQRLFMLVVAGLD